MFGSRAAQALAPRVENWNLDIVCYLLFGAWDLFASKTLLD